MTNVVDESAWWNPLLTSAIFNWLGGTVYDLTYVVFFSVYSSRRC